MVKNPFIINHNPLNFNELDIAKRCAANERAAQELLYRRFFQPMLQMCLRYTDGDKDRALEILNDGFLRVFKKIHLFEGRGSLEGWIRRLVFHAVSDYYKANDAYLKNVVFDELPIENQSNILSKHENTEGGLGKLFFTCAMVVFGQTMNCRSRAFVHLDIAGYPVASCQKATRCATVSCLMS